MRSYSIKYQTKCNKDHLPRLSEQIMLFDSVPTNKLFSRLMCFSRGGRNSSVGISPASSLLDKSNVAKLLRLSKVVHPECSNLESLVV